MADTTQRAAMQQAQQALERAKTWCSFELHKAFVRPECGAAITALRAALAEQAAEQATHDNLRDTVGQAIHDVLTGWYETEDGTIGVDPFDSRNIDEIADAVIAVLPTAPAAEQAGAIPAGWVPLRMEWEPGYPEDVAFGPPMMMERLKKWLDKHFAARVAEANAEQAEPVAVPAGYALVPVEPTEAMLAAAHEGDRQYTLRNFGDVMTVMQGPYDHWHAMIAAAPPAPARQEWQPIETAPRDGTAFRGFHESLIDLDFNPSGSVECAWDGEQFIGCVWNGQQDAWYGKPVDLSHWMPLPAAPLTAAPAEGGAA